MRRLPTEPLTVIPADDCVISTEMATRDPLFVVSLFEFGRTLPRRLRTKSETLNYCLHSKGALMTDGLRALLSPALSVRSNGVTEAFAGGSENELPAVEKRFLIAEISRLVEENKQLKEFQEEYHELDKELAILKERPFRRNLFLSSACLIAGTAGVVVAAVAPGFLSISQQYGWYIFVTVSAMLLIVGIAARVDRPLRR
jgi:hypothetical protein